MATIEILSGDFERQTTRIRYSEAGRAHLRLQSTDGPVEDLFLESEVVGVAEADAGCEAGSRGLTVGDRDKRLFVVLLRGGRKLLVRGDLAAFAEFRRAALPADQRRLDPDLSRPRASTLVGLGAMRFGSWFGSTVFARLLPGNR